MARDYQAEGLAILDAADAAGEIYNTQWQAAKDLLNRALEAEVKESLSHYDTSCNSSIYKLEQRGEKLYGITSDFCYTLHLLPSQAKKLARAKKFCTCNIALSLIAVLTVVVNRWEPISARVSAWKPLVKPGRKALSAEERKTPVRTLENTGTCGICEQNVKFGLNGKLVDHGYKITDGYQNLGYRQGHCFGVAYLPYELSTTAIEYYLPLLRKEVEKLTKSIATLPTRNQIFCAESLIRRSENKDLLIGPEDDRFQQSYQAIEQRLNSDLNQVKALIKHYVQKVLNWKKSALPG